jgi:glc operon protein GlcG
MIRKSVMGLSFVLVLAFATYHAMAQGGAPAAPQGQGQAGGGGRGGQQAPPVQGIDLATAKKMVAAAEAAATAANVKVGIAVVDVNGDLVDFVRMDGASARGVTSAQGKARAAILFGMSGKAVQEAAAAGTPISMKVTTPPAGAWEVTIQQGGLPVIKDGKVVAAIGVGGANIDEPVAQAGLDALK